MSEQERDHRRSESVDDREPAKRPYHRPEVRPYGQLRELTAGASGSVGDAGVQTMPMSRRQAKTDIRYLDAGDVDALHEALLAFPLARYRYKQDGAEGPQHLGLIIDDVEPSPLVAPDGEHVDLYAYASMAVAALQAQAAQIEDLKREVRQLRDELQVRR